MASRTTILTSRQKIYFIAAYLLLVVIWLTCEIVTASFYKPYYDWIQKAISDLGIPYSFERDEDYYSSPLATLMNSGFLITGWLYGIINLILLWMSRRQDFHIIDRLLWILRIVCSFVAAIGLTIVGLIHGGPREFENGTVVFHGSAAFFAILFSHINSIAVGIAPGRSSSFITRRSYCYGSIILGVLGIVFEIVYTTHPAGVVGLFERLTVYMVLFWVLWTASWLAMDVVFLDQGHHEEDGSHEPLLG